MKVIQRTLQDVNVALDVNTVLKPSSALGSLACMQADAASQEAKKLQQVLTEGAAEYKSAIARANEAHSHMQSLLADNATLRQQAEVCALLSVNCHFPKP